MNRRGFTITELIIGITIMAILIILGFVNLESYQVSARDAERAADIETIAIQLDAYYRSGNGSGASTGVYPSTTDLIGHETTVLRDIDLKSITAPGVSSSSLVGATCTGACVQTIAGVVPQPTTGTSAGQYVYQPIAAADGSICDNSSTKECRKFNLYYKTEADNVVHIVVSKNQ